MNVSGTDCIFSVEKVFLICVKYTLNVGLGFVVVSDSGSNVVNIMCGRALSLCNHSGPLSSKFLNLNCPVPSLLCPLGTSVMFCK